MKHTNKYSYSNPIPGYEFKCGKHPFYVAIGYKHWIPVSVIVFADDKVHALEIVKNGIQFIIDKNGNYTPDDSIALLSKDADITVLRITSDQMYSTEWAANATILNC